MKSSSSDMEIALVGANGERRGVLVLAGTGSVAYGVNDHGEAMQIGGWGYLLGDEGSGYAIGREALRTVTHQSDDTHEYGSTLYRRVIETLRLSQPKDLIAWLYGGDSKVREVAQLAALVLEEAENGDSRAHEILDTAADNLAQLAHTVIRRLNIQDAKIAFAGGLLSEPNPLSRRLCDRLNLAEFPTAKYPPVIGAALLAKLSL
jgi:N-acetylglucosamine kinase-like BadF-type ATPase